MGTVLKGSTAPQLLIQKILRVFSKLKQRVVWKWDLEAMKDAEVPQNVLLRKWLPQQNLLGMRIIQLDLKFLKDHEVK